MNSNTFLFIKCFISIVLSNSLENYNKKLFSLLQFS